MREAEIRRSMAVNVTATRSGVVEHNCVTWVQRREESSIVRSHVLTTSSMKMMVFWDMSSCNVVEDRRFRDAY